MNTKQELYYNMTEKKAEKMSTSEKEKFLQHFVVEKITYPDYLLGREKINQLKNEIEDHAIARKHYSNVFGKVDLTYYSTFYCLKEPPKIIEVNFVYKYSEKNTTYYSMKDDPLTDVRQIVFPDLTLVSCYDLYGLVVWSASNILKIIPPSWLYLLYPYLDKTKIKFKKNENGCPDRSKAKQTPIPNDREIVMVDGTKIIINKNEIERPVTIVRGKKVWHLADSIIPLLEYIDKSKIKQEEGIDKMKRSKDISKAIENFIKTGKDFLYGLEDKVIIPVAHDKNSELVFIIFDEPVDIKNLKKKLQKEYKLLKNDCVNSNMFLMGRFLGDIGYDYITNSEIDTMIRWLKSFDRDYANFIITIGKNTIFLKED